MTDRMTVSALARLVERNPHFIRGVAVARDIPWTRVGGSDVIEPEGVQTIVAVIHRDGKRRKVRAKAHAS